MSDNLAGAQPDWQWWQIAAVVVGGVATMAVVGYLASGGKSSQELRSEHHKRAQKGHGREMGEEHPRHVPRAPPKKEASHLQQLLEKGSKERDTNPRRAIETYQEALAYILKETNDPSHLFVGVVEQSLAKCYLSLEKYAVAKKKLQKSIKILQTNNVSAETIMEFRCQLALAHIFLREFAQAEEIVNAAIEMASDSAHPNQVLDAQAQDILGQLRRRQGRYREAEKAIRRAMSFWMNEFGSTDPTSIETRQRLIDILLLRGRAALAVKEANTFMDDVRQSLSESRPELQKQVLCTLLTNLGIQFVELGSPSHGEEFLLQAQSTHPDNKNAQLICNWHLACIYTVRGETERAKEMIDHLLSTPLDKLVIASIVSQYFSSRHDTGLVAYVDPETQACMLKFRITLRALEHVYPLESFEASLHESNAGDDKDDEEHLQPRVSVIDDIDDDTPGAVIASSPPSSSSSSSSTINTDRLPSSFYLVATFNGPEDTLVPDVTLQVDRRSNFGELFLESELFEAIPPGVYAITATAYTDESCEHKITEHKQYFPWKITPGSQEFIELARVSQIRRQEEADDLRVLNE